MKLGDGFKHIEFKRNVPTSHEPSPLSAHHKTYIEQGPVLEAENKLIGVVIGV